MKYDELIQMATETSRSVVQKNTGVISEKIKTVFKSEQENEKLSHQDALAKAIALALTLVPEVSAVVTAKMLVQLGLVEIEDVE